MRAMNVVRKPHSPHQPPDRPFSFANELQTTAKMMPTSSAPKPNQIGRAHV